MIARVLFSWYQVICCSVEYRSQNYLLWETVVGAMKVMRQDFARMRQPSLSQLCGADARNNLNEERISARRRGQSVAPKLHTVTVTVGLRNWTTIIELWRQSTMARLNATDNTSNVVARDQYNEYHVYNHCGYYSTLTAITI
jgi:hypothetical protein